MPDPTPDVRAFLAAALADGTATEVGVAGLPGASSAPLRGSPPPPPPDGCDEGRFQDALRLLALWGGWHYFHPHDSRRSDPDFPDTVMARSGRLVVLELKVKDKRPTPGQLEWLRLFGLIAGVTAKVAYPEDWDSLVDLLR